MPKLVELLPKLLKSLTIRFDRSPISTVESLSEFNRTRAAYIAQTSMFGYLKTRMGTSFTKFFEDEVFSRAIRAASAKLFVSCLGDVTTFAAGLCSDGAAPDETRALAEHCFARGFALTLVDLEAEFVPADAEAEFAARAALTDWHHAAQSFNAFAGSERDIVRFAPVVDEFKALDREIVSNSIRFRWRDVREQLRRRIDAQGICADWRQRSGTALER
ncbi:MAG TPA: hypothetical protein VMW31_05645 [Devosiaceae bacterium]|nr:hypothetical protein [Devosiaceae bacterium]